MDGGRPYLTPYNSITIQVGWACRQCSNVFQQESLLRNHQKVVCHGNGDAFRLIQIHYECVSCSSRLGTQVSPSLIDSVA